MTDITDEERARRIAEKRREMQELRNNPHTPRATYWMSFADATGCLGVVVVDDCVNETDALEQTHKAGVNPGGEVMTIRLPPSLPPEAIAPMARTPRLTLLSVADLAALGHKPQRADRTVH